MIMNALPPRLGKGPVRDLIHPNCARRRPIHVERFALQRPAPVSPRHGIAGAFDLREGGEQVCGNDVRGMFFEDGAVFLPRLGRRLIQRAADREEQFRWLAHDLVGKIESKPKREGQYQPDNDLRVRWQAPERPPPAPTQTRTRPELRDGEAAAAPSSVITFAG